jgi:hypothetical protein
MVFCYSCDGAPFKIQKEKRAGLQFTSKDYLSLLLTPPRIRWTIPLTRHTLASTHNLESHRIYWQMLYRYDLLVNILKLKHENLN